jgi:hypothetical protein
MVAISSGASVSVLQEGGTDWPDMLRLSSRPSAKFLRRGLTNQVRETDLRCRCRRCAGGMVISPIQSPGVGILGKIPSLSSLIAAATKRPRHSSTWIRAIDFPQDCPVNVLPRFHKQKKVFSRANHATLFWTKVYFLETTPRPSTGRVATVAPEKKSDQHSRVDKGVPCH